MTTSTLHQADHQLKTAIADELEWTPEVNADQIGIAVTEGAVALSGEVATYPEKHAAVQAALRVHGVTGVADDIVIKHRYGTREDVDIARDAAQAIASSVIIIGEVKTQVEAGRVTLTGTVPWNYQRQAATRAVAKIPGVKSVNNRITLKPTLPFAASQARNRITDALVRNAQTDADAIRIAIDGTQVILTGTVRSWAERAQAAWAAWSTPGVTDVHNNIHVKS